MSYEKTVCIIVDAFSTGKNIAPALRGMGYQSLHIQSSPNLPPDRFSSKKDHFIGNLVYDGDFENLMNKINALKLRVKLCMAGSESGVELADLISNTLKLPANGIARSRARRNKYDMIETVQQARLKTAKHFKSTSAEEIIEWARREVSQFPIVLKPLESASGDGVFFCHNEQEVKTAHAKIINNPNYFGQKNEEVLAESFSWGSEYIVNTVSCEDKLTKHVTHFVVEIWHVSRKPGTTIYDKAEIIYSDDKAYNELVKYTFKVLDALEIKNGAGTTELKYTPDGGPVLIESAARIMGSAPLSLITDLFGYNQLTLTLQALISPQQFNLFASRTYPKPSEFGMGVILISDAQGEIAETMDISALEKLETLHNFIINSEKGAQLNITVDSLTAPGEFYLKSDDPKKLQRDYHTIRKLEAQGLYQNAISPKEKAKEAIDILYNKVGLLKEQRTQSQSSVNAEMDMSPSGRTSDNINIPNLLDSN